MAEIRAIIGRVEAGAISAELKRAIVTKTTGVLRLRDGRKIGAIWTVRGEVVHALHVEDGMRCEGSEAFDRLIYLNSGTFYWELETLPPARSIRLPEPEEPVEERAAVEDLEGEPEYSELLSLCENDLKQRVPGITMIQIVQRTRRQPRTETVDLNLIRTAQHLHLSQQVGNVDVHLDASAETAPEALLWAADVIRRKLSGDEARRDIEPQRVLEQTQHA